LIVLEISQDHFLISG